MDEDPIITVNVSSEMPDDLLTSLRAVLRSEAVVQDEKRRVFTGVEWAALIVILKVTGAGAGAAAGIVALGRQINAWRRDARRASKEPPGFLERPNQPQLDLATATDAEVRNWLVAAAANREVPEWLATATDEQVRAWLAQQLNHQ
jgi:hypothetical protein